MKFAINKDGSYSHYGTDGTIEFDDKFNADNRPFNHKYVGENWVVDKEKLTVEVSDKIKIKLDELGQKLIHNETYFGSEGYDLYRNGILEKIKDNRELVLLLDTKTAYELVTLLAELKL
ncbi:MAG: hypothetical protein GY793_08570 [Proteobacteria bacterium]|nr:hypothetical protein [Pseudomonadota bacterium]